jgi:D-alanyl-lipoteichoic acid acyltransferase DltB (MBOAT superfamily)
MTAQIQTPPSLSLKARMTYLARFVVSLLCMEVLLHYVYVVAIKDTKGALQGLTAGELGVVGWLNLMVVWLKVRTNTFLSSALLLD